ncbi:MAG: lysylphosphatidylglycerol synthase transmembrane domain-containing protein [Ardenticatenia bacterium]|nr:lysylphosphatidylglycerol synthase transmembrane domain-containing protein [Ardenticatenia bacterium]
MRGRHRSISTGVGIAITLLFLWLALKDVAWNDIRVAFVQADYRWVVPAALLVAADYWFRAIRWGHILPEGSIPARRLFPILIVGFAANNVIPARVGELWRIWGLSRHEGVSKSVGLATLVVERLFDGLTLVFLLALFSALVPSNGRAEAMKYGFAALFGTVLVGVVLLVMFGAHVERLASKVIRPLPAGWQARLLDIVRRFTEGVARVPPPKASYGGAGLLLGGVAE